MRCVLRPHWAVIIARRLAALLTLHAGYDVTMEVVIVVAVSCFSSPAVFALVDRSEIAPVLPRDLLYLHPVLPSHKLSCCSSSGLPRMLKTLPSVPIGVIKTTIIFFVNNHRWRRAKHRFILSRHTSNDLEFIVLRFNPCWCSAKRAWF